MFSHYSRWFLLFLLLPLLPVILAQGIRTRRNTIRLPEAEGVRKCDNGSSLSLLHIGESTVAGVGVESIDQGLTHAVINALSDFTNQSANQSISWQILGKNGAKANDFQEMENSLTPPDILLITLGVNDTARFTSKKQWQAGLQNCVAKYAYEHTRVFLTSVPPMHRFPALPAPLSWLLGIRALQLNSYLSDLCQRNNWVLIQADIPLQVKWMAADGYHPNHEGYRLWGEMIAKILLRSEKIVACPEPS